MSSIVVLVATFRSRRQGLEPELAAQALAQEIGPENNMILEVEEDEVRARIRVPLDIDPQAPEERLVLAAREAAESFDYPCRYRWEIIDQDGELIAVGPELEISSIWPTIG